MFDATIMNEDSQDTLGKRVDRGNQSMIASWGREPDEDERESAACDTISNVLTALFGPAGAYGETDETWALKPNEFALNEARRVIEEAFRSYEGDAEDYEIDS